VEDEEVNHLFIDANDPSVEYSLLVHEPSSPLLCPFCGSSVWDLSTVDELDEIAPEWNWAVIDR
jgi:hypothetical protein